jgi:L-alanine-DL-glutamate epimerase-like enolase superfamily enzyme
MSSWNIPFAPHFLGSIVGLVATCHLFAAAPGGLIVELDSNDNPLRDKLVTPGLEIVDGNIILSGNPGWGLELDEDVLAKYEL